MYKFDIELFKGIDLDLSFELGDVVAKEAILQVQDIELVENKISLTPYLNIVGKTLELSVPATATKNIEIAHGMYDIKLVQDDNEVVLFKKGRFRAKDTVSSFSQLPQDVMEDLDQDVDDLTDELLLELEL